MIFNSVLCLLALCVPASLAAQAAPQAAPTPAPANQPYADRLIDGGNLPTLSTDTEQHRRNDSGHARSIMVELGGSIIAPKTRIAGVDTTAFDRDQREAGIAVSGRYQTDNMGLLGLDLQLHRGSYSGAFSTATRDRWRGTAALTTRDVPLGRGWLADAAAGMTTPPVIALAQRQTRFFLPTTPILGGSLTLRHFRSNAASHYVSTPEPDSTFHLSLGEPGLMGGLRLSDYTGLSGIAISGGGQTTLGSGWAAGFEAIAVNNSRDPYAAILQTAGLTTTTTNPATISAQGAMVTLAHSGGGLRVQANGLLSHRAGTSNTSLYGGYGTSGGAWIDASYRRGRTQHSGGLYYFGPGLSWGTSALINNVYGGYYRFSSASQRWRWTLNLDAVQSANGHGSSGVVVNADARRKLSFNTAVGLNSTVRVANGQTATQLLGFVEFTAKLGSSRMEAGWSHDAFSDQYRLAFNQNWTLPAWLPPGSRLSTQVAYDHRRQTSSNPYLPANSIAEKANSFGAGISGGFAPFRSFSLDATVAYNSNGSTSASGVYGPVDTTGGALGILSSEQGRAFSASVVATLNLSSSWNLSASYTDTTSRLTSLYGLSNTYLSPLGLLPADLGDARLSRYHLRAGYLTLRYAASAGRPRGALGQREYPVGGTGNLEGRIFLDANGNGQRDPTEDGVGGIVVILDGIHAIRTEPSGYYRFDGISDGRHRITLNADNLPLPWVIEPADQPHSGQPYRATIEIGVRQTSHLDIAASRD